MLWLTASTLPVDGPNSAVFAQQSCPVITIECSSDEERCCGPKYNFTVNIMGGFANRKPSYKWSVSSGKIVKGQGTGSIYVETKCDKDKPIRVTVEIGSIIPEGCPTSASFTTECNKS